MDPEEDPKGCTARNQIRLGLDQAARDGGLSVRRRQPPQCRVQPRGIARGSRGSPLVTACPLPLTRTPRRASNRPCERVFVRSNMETFIDAEAIRMMVKTRNVPGTDHLHRRLLRGYRRITRSAEKNDDYMKNDRANFLRSNRARPQSGCQGHRRHRPRRLRTSTRRSSAREFAVLHEAGHDTHGGHPGRPRA